MPLVTIVAPVRTHEKCVVEKRLHKALSPRPVNRCAATVWAMYGMSSFEYNLHDAPFQAELRSVHRCCEGGWGSTKRRSTLCGNLNPTHKTCPFSIARACPEPGTRRVINGPPEQARR